MDVPKPTQRTRQSASLQRHRPPETNTTPTWRATLRRGREIGLTDRTRQLGLTKTCNLSHNPACTDGDITQLRDLHTAMDRVILACYGWTDLDPGRGFHANERGQTRYTISPAARRDLFRRLLTLNLEIAAREAATGDDQ